MWDLERLRELASYEVSIGAEESRTGDTELGVARRINYVAKVACQTCRCGFGEIQIPPSLLVRRERIVECANGVRRISDLQGEARERLHIGGGYRPRTPQ